MKKIGGPNKGEEVCDEEILTLLYKHGEFDSISTMAGKLYVSASLLRSKLQKFIKMGVCRVEPGFDNSKKVIWVK